jgi:quercetin dioxygenase-like cupin family protein
MFTAAILPFMRGVASTIMASRAPDQVIGRGTEDVPYMERWYLMRKQETGPIENLYLHQFLRSDREDLHDHPWAWATLVLKGSYTEWSPEGEVVRNAGDYAFKSATDRHAIVSVEPGTVTLFATGPKTRDWGFHTDDGFVLERMYGAYLRFKAEGNEIGARQCVEAQRHPPRWEPGDRTPGTVVIGGGLRKVVGADGKLHVQEK